MFPTISAYREDMEWFDETLTFVGFSLSDLYYSLNPYVFPQTNKLSICQTFIETLTFMLTTILFDKFQILRITRT